MEEKFLNFCFALTVLCVDYLERERERERERAVHNESLIIGLEITLFVNIILLNYYL